ncbi:hypothetical protein TIFTF001_003299 [Ficus carica]|uniref:Uncharacterized protein n=1 Tax=Ficus carica TaxID=3494 RepID=A0AA88CTX8_FICCA|nr:hypothetical protein TIFTF001_003299 [Ficus carica]
MRAGRRVANVDPCSTGEAGQIGGARQVLCSPIGDATRRSTTQPARTRHRAATRGEIGWVGVGGTRDFQSPSPFSVFDCYARIRTFVLFFVALAGETTHKK